MWLPCLRRSTCFSFTLTRRASQTLKFTLKTKQRWSTCTTRFSSSQRLQVALKPLHSALLCVSQCSTRSRSRTHCRSHCCSPCHAQLMAPANHALTFLGLPRSACHHALTKPSTRSTTCHSLPRTRWHGLFFNATSWAPFSMIFNLKQLKPVQCQPSVTFAVLVSKSFEGLSSKTSVQHAPTTKLRLMALRTLVLLPTFLSLLLPNPAPTPVSTLCLNRRPLANRRHSSPYQVPSVEPTLVRCLGNVTHPNPVDHILLRRLEARAPRLLSRTCFRLRKRFSTPWITPLLLLSQAISTNRMKQRRFLFALTDPMVRAWANSLLRVSVAMVLALNGCFTSRALPLNF
eukprot:m.83045 g.83045  ORF g.83045 m.83045 type:complete len:345 (+) comp12709_c0_seq2:14659-15693(+)